MALDPEPEGPSPRAVSRGRRAQECSNLGRLETEPTRKGGVYTAGRSMRAEFLWGARHPVTTMSVIRNEEVLAVLKSRPRNIDCAGTGREAGREAQVSRTRLLTCLLVACWTHTMGRWGWLLCDCFISSVLGGEMCDELCLKMVRGKETAMA